MLMLGEKGCLRIVVGELPPTLTLNHPVVISSVSEAVGMWSI